MPQEPVSITGVHLNAFKGKVWVQLEIDGRWVTVINESGDIISHIVEPSGIRREAAKEPLTVAMCGGKSNCEHEFGGWRNHPDGRGGERFCQKCGLGAMAHTLANCP